MKLSLCSKKKPFGHQFYNRHSLRDLGGGLGGRGRHGGRRQQRGNGGVCNCHRQQRQSARPSVRHLSSGPKDGVQRDPVRQDSGKARKDLKRERDDLRRGWRAHKNGGVEGKAGKTRSLSSCRRVELRSKSSRSKFAGEKKETNTDAKGARRSRDHARNEG